MSHSCARGGGGGSLACTLACPKARMQLAHASETNSAFGVIFAVMAILILVLMTALAAPGLHPNVAVNLLCLGRAPFGHRREQQTGACCQPVILPNYFCTEELSTCARSRGSNGFAISEHQRNSLTKKKPHSKPPLKNHLPSPTPKPRPPHKPTPNLMFLVVAFFHQP